MSMKIQTNKKNNYNQEVLFIEGIKVKFDDKGIGIVKDKNTADKLVENSDFLFNEGQIPEEKPQTNIPILLDTKKDDKIEELTNKLHVLKQRNDSLIANKDLLENNLKDWKTEVERLTKENESFRNAIKVEKPDIIKEENKEKDIVVKDEELSIEEKLTAMKVSDLKDMCKELKLDRGAWETLKKNELIQYLIENTKKE